MKSEFRWHNLSCAMILGCGIGILISPAVVPTMGCCNMMGFPLVVFGILMTKEPNGKT